MRGADTGNEKDLLATRGVEIDRDEEPRVELLELFFAKGILENAMEREHVEVGASHMDRFRELLVEVWQAGKLFLPGEVGIDDPAIGADLGECLSGMKREGEREKSCKMIRSKIQNQSPKENLYVEARPRSPRWVIVAGAITGRAPVNASRTNSTPARDGNISSSNSRLARKCK